MSRIVFKGMVMMAPMHTLIADHFPKMKMIFNTRHPKKSLNSWMYVFKAEVNKCMMDYQYHDFWLSGIPFDYDSEELQDLQAKLMRESRVTSLNRSFAYCYAGALDFYLRHKGLYRHCVLYEDLVEDPKEEAGRLFSALGLG